MFANMLLMVMEEMEVEEENDFTAILTLLNHFRVYLKVEEARGDTKSAKNTHTR